MIFENANPPNAKANETLQIDGDSGGDTIDASGGLGFLGPLKAHISLFGSAGNDRLTGGAGTDTLYADQGDDVLDGGNGFDIASYESSPNAVNLDLGNDQPQDTGALGKDQLAHVEILKGSQYDDVLTGNDGANGLLGGPGNDLLTGRGGSDGIDGGFGGVGQITDSFVPRRTSRVEARHRRRRAPAPSRIEWQFGHDPSWGSRTRALRLARARAGGYRSVRKLSSRLGRQRRLGSCCFAWRLSHKPRPAAFRCGQSQLTGLAGGQISWARSSIPARRSYRTSC